MKQVVKFIAFNGMEFNTKEECLKYERNFTDRRTFINNNITFLDNHRQNMGHADVTLDEEDYTSELESLYDRCNFININATAPEDIALYFYSEIGANIPTTPGLYRYDIDDEKWHSAKDDISDLCELWGVRNIIELMEI